MMGFDTALNVPPQFEGSRDAGLSFLFDIVDSAGSRLEGPSSTARDELLARTAEWRPTGERPADLVGRECACSPPVWHLRKLLDLVGGPGQSHLGAIRAQRLYHARWLGHLLAPDQAVFRPLVTVLIPAFNRAAILVEAIESCLAQTWKPLEVLVVDDGSTEDLAAALERFGDTIRVERQPNGGVSSARNTGIRLAKGDLVHLLDSDNLLLPTAVSRKIDAFARFPDAGLCYSLAELQGEPTADTPQIAPPNGSANCPTVSLLAGGLRCPFYVSCVMLPRFTLLASGGFEEDLRRGEDSRFWVKLALRDTKVIGLDAKLTVRRLSRDSLSAQPMPPALHLAITARTTADCLAYPPAWPLASRGFQGLLHLARNGDDLSQLESMPERDVSRLVTEIRALGTKDDNHGMSPLPLLAHLRHLTRHALASSRDAGREKAALLRRLHAAIDAAALGAAPLAPADVVFWANAVTTRSGEGRLNSFFRRVGRLLENDPSMLPAADELLRHTSVIPRKRPLKAYARMRRWMLPRPIVLWIALRKAS